MSGPPYLTSMVKYSTNTGLGQTAPTISSHLWLIDARRTKRRLFLCAKVAIAKNDEQLVGNYNAHCILHGFAGTEKVVWLIGLTSILPLVLYIFALNLYHLGHLARIFPGSIKKVLSTMILTVLVSLDCHTMHTTDRVT